MTTICKSATNFEIPNRLNGYFAVYEDLIQKVEITRVAIKAGYANVLIIDDELARALLESKKE